jgi:hypothetical protein
MKGVKNTARVALVALLTFFVMTVTAFAAQDTGAVVIVSEDVTAKVVTSKAVTDGMIEFTYDSNLLEYADVEVNSDYVQKYAINADEAGVVKISWIAGDVTEAVDSEETIFTLTFDGSSDGAATISADGYVYVDGVESAEAVALTLENEEDPDDSSKDEENQDPDDSSDNGAAQNPDDSANNGGSQDLDNAANNGGTQASNTDATVSGSQNTTSVKTGDNNNMALWIVVFVVAAAAVAGVCVISKRRRA